MLFNLLEQVQNFGEPIFLVIHEGETLAEIKVRIQKKLQVPDEEFAKVTFFLVQYFRSYRGYKYSSFILLLLFYFIH